MTADKPVTLESKEKIRKLCAEIGSEDMSETCTLEDEALRFIDELQKQLQSR